LHGRFREGALTARETRETAREFAAGAQHAPFTGCLKSDTYMEAL
jgi:hypothetical protein